MLSRSLVLSAALCVAATGRATGQTAADSAAIRETALNYVQGWYTGDSARMRSALHPDLAKRIVQKSQDGSYRLNNMTASQLVQGTGRGFGKETPENQRQGDVAILDIFGNTASVRATMKDWIDYMHMARWEGRWVIVNVLWEMKPRS